MAWKALQRKSAPKSGSTGVRVKVNTSGPSGYPRAKIRLGGDVLAALGLKNGDFVSVLFDIQNCKIGFCRSDVRNGFRVSGKNVSGCITFATPMGVETKLLLAAEGKDWPVQMEDGGIVSIAVPAQLRPGERNGKGALE